MSYRATINDTPQQIAWGFQQEAMTITNVGSNTVYLAEDSSVQAGLDLTLDVGGSIAIDPEQTLWAVCSSNLTSSISIVKSVGERFAYASQSNKIISQVTRTNLGPGSGGIGTGYSLSVPFDNTFSTQYAAIGVFVTSPSATAASWSFRWNNYLVASGTSPQEAAKTVYQKNASTQLSLGAIFPIQAFGGAIQVAPNVAVTGTVTITVIGYNTAPQYPIPYGDPYLMANGGYEQFNHGGTYSYRATSLAASTTLDVPLPATTGAINVTVAYTQNAAGNVTITPYIITTSAALNWNENITQFDVTTTTTTLAQQFTKYNFPFYPPAYGFIRITTPAAVSLSNIVVTTSTPNQ